jgi:cytochrome c-type biogenesis protein CcmE
MVRYRFARIAVTFAVLTFAFSGLLWTSLQGGTEYYKHVDEVMTSPEQWVGRPMQLHGFVVPGSILRKPDSFSYRFKIENNGRVVDAAYEGIVPDTFKDHVEVVLSGRLVHRAPENANGALDGAAYAFHTKPDGIMAKCPSRYDPARKVG